MNHLRRLLIPLIAAIALCAPSHAAPAEAPNCRNGLFPEEGVSYGLAKITGEDKAFLIEDSVVCPTNSAACPSCPSDDAACKSKSYLIAGDLVITGRSFGAYRCVLYHNGKNSQGYAGYIPESRLQAQPSVSVTLKDWLGEWRNGDNYVSLRAKRDALSAKGEAFWPSANPSPKDIPGGPHVGEMSGMAAPAGNQVTFVDDEDECHVSLTLIPPFVLAKDNSRCGGMNVSFNGVYLRAAQGAAGGNSK